MSSAGYTLVYAPCGGMLTTQELRAIAEGAVSLGDGRVYISGRQELLLRGVAAYGVDRLLKQPNVRLVPWEAGRAPAVVTTAAGIGLPGSCEWLTRGVLADVAERLRPVAEIDVGLGDPGQTAVPVLTSRVNVLASPQRDLWRLHLLDCVLSGAVRTQDVPDAVCRAQRLLASGADVSIIADAVRPYLFELEAVPFPDVSAYGAGPGAVQIPSGVEGISAQFLIALCVLAAEAGGAALSLTHWRELCVAGLDEAARREVELQMLRHGAVASLPWGRFTCGEALEQPAHRIRAALAAAGPCDARMSWALVEAGEVLPEAHVAVERVRSRWRRRGRYNLLIREGLGARAGAWRRCAERVAEGALPMAVIEALTSGGKRAEAAAPRPAMRLAEAEPGHRCRECLSEYSAVYGDPVGGISAGTGFSALPEAWRCPVCGAGKQAYEAAA